LRWTASDLEGQMRLKGWRELSVTTKFSAAFVTFLSLILAIAIISLASLTIVRIQIRDSIVTSMEIQRLTLQMDANLQHARLLQRDFFLRWPEIGFNKAKQTYVLGNSALIDRVAEDSDRLRELISESGVSTALANKRVDINFYLSAAHRYNATFQEAVNLVYQLADEDSGAQSRLALISEDLYWILHEADDQLAISYYREMQALEKSYMAVRSRPILQSAFNVGNQLNRTVWASPKFDSGRRERVTDSLKNYQKTAATIADLDVQIRSLFKEFDLQDEAVNPISDELIALAKSEADQAKARVENTSRWTTIVIIAAVLCALGLAAFVIAVLNRSFTRNVLALTKAVGNLQAGDLDSKVKVDSGDEFGRLSEGFNDMASRIRSLVESLRGQAAIAESRLFHAIEAMEQGFSLYDSEDRLVLSNSKYRSLLYPGIENFVQAGKSFESIVRNAAESGLIQDADGRTDEWVVARVRAHHSPGDAIVQRRKGGRWVEIREHKTEDGDIVAVYTDITERTNFELQLQEEKHRTEEANALATEKNRTLEALSTKLSKYLSPQVYASIFTGRQEAAIASQRKKLTIFFSDIADFTETTDSLESEQLTELLNSYLTEMSKIALEHGATIDKYVGDAMLAFFGDPESRGVREDAAACVAMAIAMQRRMAQLQAGWLERGLERPFQLRIGINTGFCTVGNFGSEDRMDYTIIGNEVNLAARLQSHAPLGGILLAHETYALVHECVPCAEREPITVKGFAKSIRNYEVLGIDGTVNDTDILQIEESIARLRRDFSELSKAGRDQAIQLLQNAFGDFHS
jgi:class 3 adenylate cyclase/HAMP domain-containing protein